MTADLKICPRELISYAHTFIGLPYIWGGANPVVGLDCSGFCIELLKSVGLVANSFDTTAQGLFYHLTDKLRGEEVTAAAQGTFVFFGKSKNEITHVAFCLTDCLMLEAGGGGAAVRTKEDAALSNAFIRMRVIKSRRDVVAFAQPFYGRA